MSTTENTRRPHAAEKAIKITLTQLKFWCVIALMADRRGDANRIEKVLNFRQDRTARSRKTSAASAIAMQTVRETSTLPSLPTDEVAHRIPLKQLEYWYLVALFTDRKREANRLMNTLESRRAHQD